MRENCRYEWVELGFAYRYEWGAMTRQKPQTPVTNGGKPRCEWGKNTCFLRLTRANTFH